jgi:hypothetical protein
VGTVCIEQKGGDDDIIQGVNPSTKCSASDAAPWQIVTHRRRRRKQGGGKLTKQSEAEDNAKGEAEREANKWQAAWAMALQTEFPGLPSPSKATANTGLTKEASAAPVATAAPVRPWTSSSTPAVVSSLKNARGGVFAKRPTVQPEIVRLIKNGADAKPIQPKRRTNATKPPMAKEAFPALEKTSKPHGR